MTFATARISITRTVSNVTSDYITIKVTDGNRRLSFEMTPEHFALAVTGLSEQPCSLDDKMRHILPEEWPEGRNNKPEQVLYLQGHKGCALYVGENRVEDKLGRIPAMMMLELAFEHQFTIRQFVSMPANIADNEYYDMAGEFPQTRSALSGHYDEF